MVILAVLLPSAVKLTHAFNHHNHIVCNDDIDHDTHFHASDLDCDFYKFKLTKSQFFTLHKYEEASKVPHVNEILSYYISYNNYEQPLQFLRGPPQLV